MAHSGRNQFSGPSLTQAIRISESRTPSRPPAFLWQAEKADPGGPEGWVPSPGDKQGFLAYRHRVQVDLLKHTHSRPENHQPGRGSISKIGYDSQEVISC